MKIAQKRWTSATGWEVNQPEITEDQADFVLVFASREQLTKPKFHSELKEKYCNAVLLGCSTAGEICSTQVTDDSIVITAIKFEQTTLKSCSLDISDLSSSYEIGKNLVESLEKENLRHVFVLSDGLNINGSALIKGLNENLPENVTVTGGLSGDGDQFKETFILTSDGVKSKQVSVIGFYGSHLHVGCSSLGGWDAFGPERVITKSKDNILFELDGQSALSLYKTYLGEHADKLPSSGLLFPLTIRTDDQSPWLVRTILGVNEEDNSLTFAGDVPENAHARLMKANFERLIDGANGAAEKIRNCDSASPSLAILISCVGRKMILKQRIEEEVEAVQDVFGDSCILAGFYSYGEISPFTPDAKCELHNQTMTITTFYETNDV